MISRRADILDSITCMALKCNTQTKTLISMKYTASNLVAFSRNYHAGFWGRLYYCFHTLHSNLDGVALKSNCLNLNPNSKFTCYTIPRKLITCLCTVSHLFFFFTFLCIEIQFTYNINVNLRCTICWFEHLYIALWLPCSNTFITSHHLVSFLEWGS